MPKSVEKEGDRGWVAGVILVGLAALSLVLGLALPSPPGGVGLHPRAAGKIAQHESEAPSRVAP